MFWITLLISVFNIFGIIYFDVQVGGVLIADLILNCCTLVISFFIFVFANKKYFKQLRIIMLVYACLTFISILLIFISKRFNSSSSMTDYIGIYFGYDLSLFFMKVKKKNKKSINK